jgi:hypothetical protein
MRSSSGDANMGGEARRSSVRRRATAVPCCSAIVLWTIALREAGIAVCGGRTRLPGVYTLARMPPRSPTGTENGTLDDVEEVTAEPVADGEGPRPAAPGSGSALAAPLPEVRGGPLAAFGGAPVVVQAAAVAATGIVAGVATGALVRAARGRGPAARSARSRRSKDGVEVLETRTYVVDVHVLGRR